MTPRVSIIIPNQKNAPLVAETMETVLRQTMNEWELIVVDDGSDTALPEIIQSYNDRNRGSAISLIIVSDRPTGIPALVNSGRHHTRGEYFAWLNPGELLEPGKLETQVVFLDANPEAGLVHSACITIDPNGREIGEFYPSDDAPNAFLRLLERDCINPNTSLVRRRILDEVGPFVETDRTFPELWRASAYRHTLRIALRSEIGCVNQVLQKSCSWSPVMEYSRLSLGTPLERSFVADCFEEHLVNPTPEIVATLSRNGLMGVSSRAFRTLSVSDQDRALDLLDISGLDRTWFARHSDRHSDRWSSPAFSTSVPPTRPTRRIVRDESQDLSETTATRLARIGAADDTGMRPGDPTVHPDVPVVVQLTADTRGERMLIEQAHTEFGGNLIVEKVPKVPNRALERHLLNEIEGLQEALETDRLLAARMALDWASNAANFAVGSQIATETAAAIPGASAGEIYYEQFLPNRGAVFCGGMAEFYDGVLKLFGYDSFTINYGDLRNGLSHVVVIVPVLDGPAWRHYLFDPTFNTTFHDRASGCQLDFFELVDALRSDSLDWVEVISRSVQGRDWVSIGALKESFFGLKEVMGDRYVYGRSDGRLTDYIERYKREFAANGYGPGIRGFVQLMRARMFAHGPCDCREATNDFAEKLRARGIPFGPAE